jgi:hypothetical protein
MDNLWDFDSWKDAFFEASNNRDSQALRTLRIKVFEDTLEAVNNGFYIINSGEKILFKNDKSLIQNTKFYRNEIVLNSIRQA